MRTGTIMAALLSAAATIGPSAGFVPVGQGPRRRPRPRTSTPVAVASAAPPPTAPAVPRRAAAPDTPPMLSLPMPELTELLGGSGRAKTFWEALCQGEDPRAKASAPVLEALGLRDIIPSKVQLATGSEDGTTKMLIELRDGLAVEAVLIPQPNNRPSTTLCVSSQVGCDRACQFCATGTMGLVRNLSADEILSQMFHGVRLASERGLPPIGNVVFMGQGEAGRNPEAVVAAASALTDQKRFALSKYKVTISTVGVDAASFHALAGAPAMLAWSVHAADADLRQQLVPTSRATPPEMLRDALAAALQSRPGRARTLMIAVTLLDGINDRPEDARKLAEFLKPLFEHVKKIAVDLIPYNPHDGAPVDYRRPSKERVQEFQNIVREHSDAEGGNVFVTVRLTRGDEEMSACGQLVTSRQAVVSSAVEEQEAG